VNLAARVEGLNKELGTDLLITDATRRALSLSLALQGFAPQVVKGRREPVEVFALLEPPAPGRG
jgi:adenylate cyclase